MKKNFGTLPSGEQASLYTISCGNIVATVSDYGAHLVSLMVPDKAGNVADVVLGYDDCNGYRTGDCFFGAIVGRNANRIGGASFKIGENTVTMPANENSNNLHSGPDFFHLRMWEVVFHTSNSIILRLNSPDGDQGFPGRATIEVTYELDPNGGLHIIYDGDCDRDTVFNLTNHSYFNLAGHEKCNAMDQLLTIPGEYFTPADAQSIPTGELRHVEGTPMDFRKPKPIGQDIDADYECLNLQGGYDHNWEVWSNPGAILQDPVSGRTMTVFTDVPGVQFYAGNYIKPHPGKGGVIYTKRSGICLETQYYPDSVHHSDWAQPIVRAGDHYHSETIYWFG
ncbi:MAG: galactose mutarotase [Oscillospiraceae bacterium]|nr:galactose mutarotase [Oscillospiraceae bacterium]